MTRTITIEHDGVTYSGQLGTITSTRLGYEGHGILTTSLAVEWQNGGVSAGGYVLDRPRDIDSHDYTRTGTAYGLDFILRTIETLGVESWEQIKGKQVIVLFEGESIWGGQSVGIASTTDEDKVFVFKKHAEEWREKEGL